MPPGPILFTDIPSKIITNEIYEIRNFDTVIDLDYGGKNEAQKMLQKLTEELKNETDTQKIYDLKFQIAYINYFHEFDSALAHNIFSEIKDRDTIVREYAIFFYAETLRVHDKNNPVIKNMFENIITFFPESPLQNMVNLKIARIYAEEKNYRKVMEHLHNIRREDLSYTDKKIFKELQIKALTHEKKDDLIRPLCPQLDVVTLLKELPEIQTLCDYRNKELKREEIFALGESYKKNMKYTDAIYLFEEYIQGTQEQFKKNNALKEIADCYKRMGNLEEQARWFAKLRSEAPDAQGLERFAVLELKREKYNEAKELLARAYNDFQTLSDELLFMLGRVQLEEYNLEQAKLFFGLMIEKFKNSSLVQAAQFRLGMIAFIEGRYTFAKKYFEEIENNKNEEYAISALYWKARTLDHLDSKSAYKLFGKIIESYPLHYYGILARNFIAAKPKTIDSNFNGVYATRLESLDEKTKKYLATGEYLLKLGLFSYAKKEIEKIDTKKIKSFEFIYYRAVLQHFLKDHFNAAMTLTKIPNEKLPPNHVYIKWSRGYFDLFTRFGEEFKINPYIPLSIARQETILRNDAVSPADAMGLMQIIPKTANEIAKSLGIQNFRPEVDLFDPEINIRLGTYLISSLANTFNNNSIHTIAAYNAGKEIVEVWNKTMKNIADREIAIELIPYKETREYVKRVLQNIMVYELLYDQKNIKLDFKKGIR